MAAAAGLSQLQMAVRLEISRTQISHLENGKRSASASLIERYRALAILARTNDPADNTRIARNRDHLFINWLICFAG
jgi:transcriptional regulator with XRE-family HTH domain